MHIRISKFFSMFIPQFIFSILFYFLYDDDFVLVKDTFLDRIGSFILGIWNFFVHRILLVFFIIFNIVNIGCIFGACDNVYGGGSNNISKFIANHFVYDNIDFDYERIKYSNREDMILQIIQHIRSDMYNNQEFKKENGFDSSINEEMFFKKILSDYKNYIYENYGNITGYYIYSEKYNGTTTPHIYYIDVEDKKDLKRYFYKYDYINNRLTEISMEEYLNFEI